MKQEINFQESLVTLFCQWSGSEQATIELLPVSGSYRKYFRICSPEHSAIGVYNPDGRENLAFLQFTKHFLENGLSVPEILAEEKEKNIYLLQDLGDETMFSVITKERAENGFSEKVVDIYKKVITCLPGFQLVAGKNLDYSYCYPRARFDKQSMLWDLNYFKYYFLKLLRINFDEQELEDDFEKFTSFLLNANDDYFLYRDFQSRNIMIVNNEPFFIDYQGGRRGALQYDIASLLWDAKADIPMETREEFFDFYMEEISHYIKIDNELFRKQYFAFVYIRIMQALGAYGFRGFYERKEHFLLSIPYAVKNLEWLLHHAPLPVEIPALRQALEGITAMESLKFPSAGANKLTINLFSFSYKNGIPQDFSGHGGGFVFDCRALPNPGRYREYAEMTGLDKPVIEYLERENEIQSFFNYEERLISQAVENYLERGFNRLMISFGCTGGQHRSVYFAERFKRFLTEKYNVSVNLVHREI